jgi:hypothetical protein
VGSLRGLENLGRVAAGGEKIAINVENFGNVGSWYYYGNNNYYYCYYFD